MDALLVALTETTPPLSADLMILVLGFERDMKNIWEHSYGLLPASSLTVRFSPYRTIFHRTTPQEGRSSEQHEQAKHCLVYDERLVFPVILDASQT